MKKLIRVQEEILMSLSKIKKLDKVLASKTLNLNSRKLLAFDLRNEKEKLSKLEDEEIRIKQLMICTKEQKAFDNYLDNFLNENNINKN